MNTLRRPSRRIGGRHYSAPFAFIPGKIYVTGDNEKGREIAWRFLCDVNHFARLALECELALGVEGKENPFKKLIEIYRIGAFPIEYAADEFLVFAP